MAERRSGLGRGYGALFEDNTLEDTASGSNKLKLTDIEPNKDQPRKIFDDALLSELAASISKNGVLQPIVVRPLSSGTYQIIAGERRWRAARMAGLTEIPAVIKELSDEEALEITMVENLQREDLNPLEEAQGYRYMMQKLGITQEEAAERVGKSRPSVANSLRLLNLPTVLQVHVGTKKLSVGHARAILGLKDQKDMIAVANLVMNDGISVRETEKIVKNYYKQPRNKPAPPKRDSFYQEVELSLKENLGRVVKVKENAKNGSGVIEIEFFSQDDLSGLAMKLENYGK